MRSPGVPKNGNTTIATPHTRPESITVLAWLWNSVRVMRRRSASASERSIFVPRHWIAACAANQQAIASSPTLAM